MEHSVDERGSHHFIPEDSSPFFESLVGSQYGRSVFIASADKLEKKHSAAVRDRQVANLVDDQQGWMG